MRPSYHEKNSYNQSTFLMDHVKIVSYHSETINDHFKTIDDYFKVITGHF